MKHLAKGKTQLGFVATLEERDQLRAIANEHDVNVSTVLRWMLKRFLDDRQIKGRAV